MKPWLLSIAIAYLLGSIPFGYLLVRLFRHEDIRNTGSGNIGATNVARSGAKGLGVLTLILDALKGYVSVIFALHLSHGNTAFGVVAAVAAILGHVFPIWLRFRGGKGVATALGVFLALTPATALAVLAVFVIVFALTRYVSLASIIASAAFPFIALYFIHDHTPIVIGGLFFIPLLIILKHHQNIRRLLAGTEHRFGSPKVAA
jgi:acyl phosphate:glycerol-3-phosphate acyltransferase